jgi:hypothetical protein
MCRLLAALIQTNISQSRHHMNIEDANRIPMSEILSKTGFKQVATGEFNCYEFSYDGRTIRKIVVLPGNRWQSKDTQDTGEVLDFVVCHLNASGTGCSKTDALRWLDNLFRPTSFFKHLDIPDYCEEDKKYSIVYAEPIDDLNLKRYLGSRGIPVELGKKHLQELTVRNTLKKKRGLALGYLNEEGGWYIFNSSIKANVGNLGINFIRGKIAKPSEIHIFRNITDYLSAIVWNAGNSFDGDSIVLNSPQCMEASLAYVKGYGYKTALTWLKNNRAGRKARHAFQTFFLTEPDLIHIAMNQVYSPFPDVNSWLMASLAL